MPATPTFSRYTEIPYDKMTPEQQEGYRSLLDARGPGQRPLSPGNKIFVHNPKLVKVMGPLGAYFRADYSLSERKREKVIYEMATCLANSRWVSKGLFDRAVEALGHEGITDVICLMGFYTSVSMTLAFYDVPSSAEGSAR